MAQTSVTEQGPPIGGAGNNLTNPLLDAVPGSAMLSIAPLNADRSLVDAPNARTLSNALSTQPEGVSVPDASGASGFAYVWGQFQDHDLDRKLSGTEDISITVPAGDPDLPDGTIIPLTRAALSATDTEINTVTPRLDLSQVYGSDMTTAASLRNADGTMKTSADGTALPLNADGTGFIAGDVRVNENPDLVAITTLFVRNHNTLVGDLRAAHHDWNGDQLYSEAHRINIAQYQNITYTEFLPQLIGPISPYSGYDPSVNPQVTQEFAVGAFRVGHSQVSDQQVGVDNQGNQTFSQSLAESFFNMPGQTIANGINALLRGLPADDSQAVDLGAVNGLRNLLAAPPNAIDLIATDIQRERDAGLGTLNETRIALGLAPYTAFDQLTSDPVVQANLERMFGSIDNVDLFIGGLAENHAPTGLVGETFHAIIADQYTRARDGDRFFFENEKFDPQTTAMIHDTTLGDIISRNTGTPALQQNVFVAAERHASDVAAVEPDGPQLVIGVNADDAVIAGGPADDTIVAGLGDNQTLTGGDGADVFEFLGQTQDAISDFQDGTDKVRFTFDALPDFHITANGPDSIIHYGKALITVQNVAPAAFSAADFVLPPGVHAQPGIVG